MTTLADAIIDEQKKRVIELLQAGTDVNAIDEYGFTPLIESAIVNNIDIAKLLISYNAEINKPDVTGTTALHWAVDNHNLPLCQLLLEHKADPNVYTAASQTPLINPLLRDQSDLKQLLYRHGADLNFAQDFIRTKLLGHRFQLQSVTDIINSKGEFVELDFEGFFLEFTLTVVRDSLARFRNNFSAKELRDYFKNVQKIIDALSIAAELIKYQQYSTDLNPLKKRVDVLLNNDFLIIPLAYEGHAISLIKHGDLVAKCDRGANSKHHGTVTIYKLTKPKLLSKEAIKQLIYEKQSKWFIDEGIYDALRLNPMIKLPIPAQLTGNCSWANVEASIPTALFMLEHGQQGERKNEPLKKEALYFYDQWQNWDQDRALHDCIESFYQASPARKASIASTLAAVLFQTCRYTNKRELARANKIFPIVTTPDYKYTLDSYIQIYYKQHKTPAGKNLMQLLELCGVSL